MCSVPPNRFQPNGHLQIQRLPNLQLAKWKPPPAPRLTAVLHLWVFLATKQKNYIFLQRKQRGGGNEETVCLIRQPARAFRSGHPRSGQIIIGCRGGSGAAGSVPDPARSGLWMQIKLFPFFFIKRLVEKTNPKKLQCGEDRAVRPNAAKWLNYQNG